MGYSPWGHKESYMTWPLSKNKLSNPLTGTMEGFLLGYILGLLTLVFHQRRMFSLSFCSDILTILIYLLDFPL